MLTASVQKPVAMDTIPLHSALAWGIRVEVMTLEVLEVQDQDPRIRGIGALPVIEGLSSDRAINVLLCR